MSKTEILGMERRRKYTNAEKKAMLAEAMESSLSAVARKYGINRPVLQAWKKKFQPKAFAMVEVKERSVDPSSTSEEKTPMADLTVTSPGMIRVVIHNRIAVEFPMSVEPSAVVRFIKALEG